MRTPTGRQKPRKTKLVKFPVPTGGLISNRNLALPDGQVPGASMLDNWFPTPSGAVLRRGRVTQATIAGGLPVKATFSFVLGANKKLFSAVDTGIWDVTTSTPASVYSGTTNGDWVVLQFSTAGATFLIGVNGVDTGFIYDGTTFWPYLSGGVFSLGVASVPGAWVAGVTITGGTSGATATIVRTATGILYIRTITGTFQLGETLTGSAAGSTTVNALVVQVVPGVTGLASPSMAFVWAYKQRVYFIERNSLDAWYLPVDQVGGTVTKLPLGGVFQRGGSLLIGQTWSLDTGGDGGLAEQVVFITTEGEVAAYQGLSPADTATWGKVGTYQIGVPLGKKAWIRAGGDLVICTSIGFIPLGKAIQRDYAALGQVAISNPIADEWAQAVISRGLTGWIAELWPEGKMVLIAPPTPTGSTPIMLVSNSDSGAWCRFTNWQAYSLKSFDGRLFIGADAGVVQQGWTGGSDGGIPYTGTMAPLFNDLGASASMKTAQFGQIVTRGRFAHEVQLTARFDWDLSQPTVPSSPAIPAASVWDLGLWDSAMWDAGAAAVVQQELQALGGAGIAATVVVQVTSASTVPLDVEAVRIDFAWQEADALTGP
jgi:hypothetical protein